MKTIFISAIYAIFTLVSVSGKFDYEKNLEVILSKADYSFKLQKRVRGQKELNFLPNKQTPYTGWVKDMYGNGQVRYLGAILDGRFQLEVFWHTNGQMVEEIKFKNGKKSGLVISYRQNGTKWTERTYKEGKLEGKYKQWHDSGTKWVETNYKNGEKDGLQTMWYENGKKETERNYKDGKKDGLWIFYNEDGTERERLTYRDGEIVED